MKKQLSLFSLFVVVSVLLSSCGLKYSDQGKPLDFLRAKRYGVAKEKKQDQQEEFAQEESEEPTGVTEKLTAAQSVPLNVTDTTGVDMPIWAYILISIFVSPLAVGLYEGITNRWWLNLVLYIIGAGVGFINPIGYLAAVLAVVHAILIVLDVI